MLCPYCNSKTNVTNSRSRQKGSQIWRRRACVSCGSTWTTHEVINLSTSHKVINRDGRLEPFSRDKLFLSIKDSLRHRKTALADSTELTDTILQQILALKTAKIQSSDVSSISYRALSRFDNTAAAVYKATYK